MRLMAAAVASLGLAVLGGCATAADAMRKEPMIGLDHRDAAFVAAATRTFPYPRMRCFEAVISTFRNTRHGEAGIEKADPASGAVISSKATVYSGTANFPNQTARQEIIDNKFFVQVRGEEASCTVTVTKLRVWDGTVEVERGRKGWVEHHLRGFMKGVEEEASAH
jgi:hypothetical protein